MASVVGTDLWNFAMPRIRYLQGDFAEWHAPNPSQGLRRLKRIVGRQDMQLISPTFGAIDPGRILEIFDTTLVPEPAGIAEFRLVQKTREDVRLLVRLAGNRGGAKDAIARFQTRFSEIFGEQNDLKIEFVEALPNLGVKKRCILREFHA
jgi:phenylacetate-CoA ligase